MDDFYLDIKKYIEQNSEKYNEYLQDYAEDEMYNSKENLYDNYNNKYFQQDNYLDNNNIYDDINDYEIFYKNYEFFSNKIYNENK